MMFTITLTNLSINENCPFFCISIIHHFCIHSFKSESHKSLFFSKGQSISKVARRPHLKPTRIHSTRENTKKQMDKIEKEVHELRKEVTTLQCVREAEYHGSFTGGCIESAAFPAKASTMVSGLSTFRCCYSPL